MEIPRNCSLVIIKPHVLRSNRQSEVINGIINNGNFMIAGYMVVHIHSDMANEFFKVYRNILPSYAAYLDDCWH